MDNYGESNWPGRLAQLCKTKKIEKIEPASQFEEAAEQFQLVKKGKKVSWKRLDCQDELHRSMTNNKFTTLTLGEEEQEFDEVSTSIGGNCSFALSTAVQETCAKKKGKHEEEHRHAREGLGMFRWRLRQEFLRRSACMDAWRRVSIAIDSACDSVISTEHVPDHEVHESVESRRGENFSICHQRANS